jgi:predicted nucleic acid-binding protein
MEEERHMSYMRTFWVDACTLVKLVCNETGSENVRSLLAEGDPLETTWLCVAEVYGALKTRLVKEKSITQDAYHEALYTLRRWIELGNVTVRTAWLEKGRDFGDAIAVQQLAKKYGVDFSDAMQLHEFRSGVMPLGTALSTPVFVTSDGDLLDAAKAEGMKVWDPEKDGWPPE